ncbi:MAG: hypothetical protein N2593_03805 [Patescibacteria group bacterium]|nr:hypothetical protein [Patescibacteria group bacterium]
MDRVDQKSSTELSIDNLFGKERKIYYCITDDQTLIKIDPDNNNQSTNNQFKKNAEIYYEEINGEKRLQIDFYKLTDKEKIKRNVDSIIKWFFLNTDPNKLENIKIIINVIEKKGDLRIPLIFFKEPNIALRKLLDNIPLFIERKNIRHLLRTVFKEAEKNDYFLKNIYQKNDNEVEIFLSELLKKYGFNKDEFSKEALDYLEKFKKKLIEKYFNLRDNFSSEKVIKALDLSDDELYTSIDELPLIKPIGRLPIIILPPKEQIVPVSNIISGTHINTGAEGNKWSHLLIRRGSDYMKEFLRKILRGEINLNDSSIDHGYNLLHLGNGYYVVLNGHHRTVFAKILGLKKIKANIIELIPKIGEKIEIPISFLDEIKQRIKNNLISGELINEGEKWFIILNKKPEPWVMYEDMNKAKEFFQQFQDLQNFKL